GLRSVPTRRSSDPAAPARHRAGSTSSGTPAQVARLRRGAGAVACAAGFRRVGSWTRRSVVCAPSAGGPPSDGPPSGEPAAVGAGCGGAAGGGAADSAVGGAAAGEPARSEEHTSELQSRFDLVCRLLLEKKKDKTTV